MPIKFINEPVKPRTGRGGHYDEKAKLLAPRIRELQSEGVWDPAKIAQRLNEASHVAPSGGPFSKTTTRRLLLRLRKLWLADGPRSLSTAAAQRPQRPYKFRPRKSKPLKMAARKALEGWSGDCTKTPPNT